MQALFSLLNGIALMSPELQAYLTKILKRVEFKAGDIIAKDGKIFDRIYFIEQGVIRIFHLAETEVTTWILLEGDLFISPVSFFKQLVADESIVAVKDCICWGITRKELEEVCRLFPEFLWHRTRLTEEYYLRDLQRRKEMQLRTALDRFTLLIKQNPPFMYRVSVELLASYLGIKKSSFYKAQSDYLKLKDDGKKFFD